MTNLECVGRAPCCRRPCALVQTFSSSSSPSSSPLPSRGLGLSVSAVGGVPRDQPGGGARGRDLESGALILEAFARARHSFIKRHRRVSCARNGSLRESWVVECARVRCRVLVTWACAVRRPRYCTCLLLFLFLFLASCLLQCGDVCFRYGVSRDVIAASVVASWASWTRSWRRWQTSRMHTRIFFAQFGR